MPILVWPPKNQLTQRSSSVLGVGMSDTIGHPSTRFFMGYEPSVSDRAAAIAAWDQDHLDSDDYGDEPVEVCHIWPLMNFNVADARWKTGLTTEVELYALCGVRLRSYMPDRQGRPVEIAEHWLDREVCTECEAKWRVATRTPPPPPPPPRILPVGDLFVALHTGNPGQSGDAHEVSGGSYARQPITFKPEAATLAYVSKNEVKFPSMPGCGLTHFTIHDATGKMLFSGKLTQPRKVPKGSTASFATGSIRVTL
jgi:hypothetical protein